MSFLDPEIMPAEFHDALSSRVSIPYEPIDAPGAPSSGRIQVRKTL